MNEVMRVVNDNDVDNEEEEEEVEEDFSHTFPD